MTDSQAKDLEIFDEAIIETWNAIERYYNARYLATYLREGEAPNLALEESMNELWDDLLACVRDLPEQLARIARESDEETSPAPSIESEVDQKGEVEL